MISRIIISGDLLRTKNVNGVIENFHLKRINKYYHFLKYPVEEAVNLPVEKLNTDNTDFSPEYFYKLCSIEYGYDENWLKIYDLESISKEAIDYYLNYIRDALVIYIEMPLIWKRIHKIANVPYIDLTVHPIRFLDDHMLGISTNSELIFNRIKKYQINEMEFYQQANMIKAIVDYNPLPIAENAALIVGQTNIDKALYCDGKCLSIMDFEEKIIEMGTKFDVVYYKKHPFNKEFQKIYDYLQQFDFIRLCPSDWNTYKILCNTNLKKVYAITSGVLYEAPYFGIESESLYKPYLHFDYSKECLYNEDIYLSIYNDFMCPKFWHDALQDIIKVNDEYKDLNINFRPNRIRATFNDYWSYTELDPTIITVGKHYNDRITKLEKLNSLKNEVNYLNEKIALLNNQVSILRSDPCFEKNIIKRIGKRTIFSICQNSIYFNPIIVQKKLISEMSNYKESDSLITSIKGITYRPNAPKGGRGGGGAVLSAMQAILGNAVGEYQIKYNYSEGDGIWHTLKNRYFTYSNYERFINEKSNLLPLYAAIAFVLEKTKNEKGVLYVCHEYATGYALSLLNKKYILVVHTQGTRVDEKLALGEKMSASEMKVIKKCEKQAIEKAVYTCFPSKGAEEIYFSSKHCLINKDNVSVGPCLYNTVYVEVTPEKVERVEYDENCLTFLSVGTLTSAKGQDNVCTFMRNFLRQYTGQVRWICVGKGPLCDNIIEMTNELSKEYVNFEYIYIPKLPFAQVQYLYSIADIYIMLHRISVFDLSTLEAMKNSCAIVLSKIGGNIEYNIEDNIIYAEDSIDCLFDKEKVNSLKEKNKYIYNNYFSEKCFKKRYENLILNTIYQLNKKAN